MKFVPFLGHEGRVMSWLHCWQAGTCEQKRSTMYKAGDVQGETGKGLADRLSNNGKLVCLTCLCCDSSL